MILRVSYPRLPAEYIYTIITFRSCQSFGFHNLLLCRRSVTVQWPDTPGRRRFSAARPRYAYDRCRDGLPAYPRSGHLLILSALYSCIVLKTLLPAYIYYAAQDPVAALIHSDQPADFFSGCLFQAVIIPSVPAVNTPGSSGYGIITAIIEVIRRFGPAVAHRKAEWIR